MYTDEGELEFDEDEMASLEGQRLVTECGECKEGSVHLTLALTTIFWRCQQTVQLPPVPKPIQLKQTTSPKWPKDISKEII